MGFDYCIMEEPGRAIGAWDVKDVVYGLGRLRIAKRGGEEDGLEDGRGTGSMLEAMYGGRVASVYDGFRRVVYEGGWTGGWWVEWGLERKLYVLKKGYAVRGGAPQGID